MKFAAVRSCITTFILILIWCGTVWADIPELVNKGKVMEVMAPLNGGPSSTPCVTDWNNDGAIDLLVGNSAGYIRLYLNSGTNFYPLFNGYSQLKCAGVYINMTAG